MKFTHPIVRCMIAVGAFSAVAGKTLPAHADVSIRDVAPDVLQTMSAPDMEKSITTCLKAAQSDFVKATLKKPTVAQTGLANIGNMTCSYTTETLAITIRTSDQKYMRDAVDGGSQFFKDWRKNVGSFSFEVGLDANLDSRFAGMAYINRSGHNEPFFESFRDPTASSVKAAVRKFAKTTLNSP